MVSCRRGEQRLGGGVARSESLNDGEGGRGQDMWSGQVFSYVLC